MTEATDAAQAANHLRTVVPSCSLSDEELRLQLERQRRVRPGVSRIERRESVLSIDFHPGFDRVALEEMIAVERRCCPFFQFELDERRPHLVVSVDAIEHRPALEAIAAQLA